MVLGSSRYRYSVGFSIFFLLAIGNLPFRAFGEEKQASELDGTWVCLTRSYTVQFHDGIATFKGLNPFVSSSYPYNQYVSQYVEVALPYSSVPDGAGITLEFDRAAFDAIRDQLKLLPVQAVHFAQAPFAICNLAQKVEGKPAELAFTIVPRNRIYRNEDQLRRLSDEEIAEYGKLQGAWEVEIKCEQAILRSATVALIPGWIFEKPKAFEPTIPFIERQYPEQVISRCEIDPALHKLSIFELVTARGGGGFLRGGVWQNGIREHGVMYAIDKQTVNGKMSSPFYEPLIAELQTISGLQNPEAANEKPKNAEAERTSHILGILLTKKHQVTLEAKRIEGQEGEDTVATWLRTSYPERPLLAQFTGEWSLKSHLKWKPGVKENEGFVDAPLDQPQDWTISWDQLHVVSKDAEFDRSYHFSYFYENDCGVVTAKLERGFQSINLKFRLDGNSLVVQSGRTLNWPGAIDRRLPALPERFILVRQKE